ncbi:MAG TPA: hypothetical protein VF131_28405 [Blastocatellia bacterium]|nr:hypothetical protein [Blastocatellia bacterium]
MGRTESTRELLILPFEGGQPLKRLSLAGWGSRLQWVEGGKALIYAAELDGVTALVKQSLGGGPPERIVDFAEDELFDFAHSIDGRFLAVTRGSWQHDIVLISGLNQH